MHQVRVGQIYKSNVWQDYKCINQDELEMFTTISDDILELN